jgi:hypothetical protein
MIGFHQKGTDADHGARKIDLLFSPPEYFNVVRVCGWYSFFSSELKRNETCGRMNRFATTITIIYLAPRKMNLIYKDTSHS